MIMLIILANAAPNVEPISQNFLGQWITALGVVLMIVLNAVNLYNSRNRQQREISGTVSAAKEYAEKMPTEQAIKDLARKFDALREQIAEHHRATMAAGETRLADIEAYIKAAELRLTELMRTDFKEVYHELNPLRERLSAAEAELRGWRS